MARINSQILKAKAKKAPPKVPVKALPSTDKSLDLDHVFTEALKEDHIIYGYSLSQWQEILGKPPTLLEIEFACFNSILRGNVLNYRGGLRKWEHLKRGILEFMRMSGAKNPDGSDWKYEESWYPPMDWFLWAVCDEVDLIENTFGIDLTVDGRHMTTIDTIALVAFSNASKTWFVSRVLATIFLSAPQDFLGYLTTTDAQSLQIKLWADIKNYISQCPEIHSQFTWKDSMQDRSVIFNDNARSGMHAWAVARGKKAVAKFSGGRNPFWTIICTDEAEQTEAAIFSAAANLRQGVRHPKHIMLGNPNSISCSFAQFYRPPGGIGEEPPLTPVYLSENGTLVIQLDSLRVNPNVLMEPDLSVEIPFEKQPCKFLQNRNDIFKIKNKYGENSVEWWMWVRGWPAPGDIGRRLILRSAIKLGQIKDEFNWVGAVHQGAALDVAYDGGDRCVWIPYRVGDALMDIKNAVTGKMQSEIVAAIMFGTPVVIQVESNVNNPVAYQIAGRVRALNAEHNVEADYFGMDATNHDGAYAILYKEYSTDIIGVCFGDVPTERKFRNTDTKTCRELCDRFVTEMWMAAGIWMGEGQVRGVSDLGGQELGAREFEIKAGDKKAAETKRKMRERVKYSPDEADAVCIAIEVCRRKGYNAGGRTTGGVGVSSTRDPMASVKWRNSMIWKPKFGGGLQFR